MMACGSSIPLHFIEATPHCRNIQGAVILAEGRYPDLDFGRTVFLAAIDGKGSGSPAAPRMTPS